MILPSISVIITLQTYFLSLFKKMLITMMIMVMMIMVVMMMMMMMMMMTISLQILGCGG